MPLRTSALACATAAGAIGSSAVADQRVGLALSLAVVLVLAAGWLATPRRRSIAFGCLAAALALQPVLLDAGWVVAVDVAAAVLAGAIAVTGAETWTALANAMLSPLQLVGGSTLIAGVVRRAAAAMPGRHVWPVARGLGLGTVLTVAFGALFVAADRAFADLVRAAFSWHPDAPDIAWRVGLGLAFVALAGALMRAPRTSDVLPAWPSPPAPGRVELRIALSAVVALFGAFVAVQLHVLFGGAAYVERTTGLGYGEYARQGFVQLLVVSALTLVIVAVAARRPDRTVRALLGALCGLTLVVLVSAFHRLELVEDAYGFTRVRYAGDAIVIWFAAMFALVIAAGLRRGVARRIPQVASMITLAGVLAFSLSNPDARIADGAVARAASGRPLDVDYLSGLSADALPSLARLKGPDRDAVVAVLRERLSRGDGIAGWNLSRALAR